VAKSKEYYMSVCVERFEGVGYKGKREREIERERESE